jgi:predicted nuclease of restriction endonuclease-like (RecB) superfamily
MTLAIPADEYARFLATLEERIREARAAVARTVNYGIISLYWDLGKAIAEKRAETGWGEAVVEKLSRDLRRRFPGTQGFSPQNLRRMQRFHLAHSSPEFLSQAASELRLPRGGEKRSQAVSELLAAVPWGHFANALLGIEDPAARLYYIRATAQFGWSRDVLINQIKADAYERAVKEKKSHNFALTLPPPTAAQADEILKSRYSLEFLGIGQAVDERELEDRLIGALQAFLLELGYGFCFVGRQYRLTLGRKEYFVDLLFYHRFLKALVAFEIKIGPFEPEHAGKMDFYLNLLNEKERAPDDAPSIGIILCAQKDDVEVEFALKTKANPIGVAEYQLQPRLPAEFKGRLPSAGQLAAVVRDAMPSRKAPNRGT